MQIHPELVAYPDIQIIQSQKQRKSEPERRIEREKTCPLPNCGLWIRNFSLKYNTLLT